MDSSDPSPFSRSRSKTVQSVAITESVDPDALPIPLSGADEGQDVGPDVFEKTSTPDLDDSQQGEEVSVLSRHAQEQEEELPIELISLTDRFVKSLGAKVHSSPPTIEKISNRFQEFYVRAESHIATHISALASRINRDPSPYRPLQSKSKNDPENSTPSRQMLTASEVTEKRLARKQLASKRVALEEAVERRACESIYDKIWRHKSTLDEVRDEKLRSKTAALLLVGINLKDLGIEIDLDAIDEEKRKAADECLSVARDCLANMDKEKYPLGKLQHLAAAHKAIVDALTKLFPSSSSADEILPTLIYSLITCPPEGINIISNLLFIQRFRSSSKIDGETAYCLTNLEAAISFLENVDLSELRADELQEGQLKSAGDDTIGSVEKPESLQPPKELPVSSVTPTESSAAEISMPTGKDAASETLPRTQLSSTPQQRLNSLFQPPSKVLGAANDAVRNTADQGLKNIGATLDSSFNFLFGRLKELQSGQLPGSEGVSGQRTPRDRSVDSARTQSSSRKSVKDEPVAGLPQGTPAGSSSFVPAPLESMRNFGNTLNPLNHIPGMIRNFGRGTPDTPGGTPSPSSERKASFTSREVPSNVLSSSQINPPIQRFLQMQDANDLTLRDVSLLLEDYKRISAALLKQPFLRK
ncbi:conserved hypothetical protein [Aspergillus terreus NIH2624]|uniref:VPS9 domain-containing protein n=1 Tax=Aspergillus terreus (strain NIH 2624 / FGSC A1156) TaxID=341663 RepID=Q0CXU5_ASPTN|nr:uncharacterized protein ATEG_01489 [Aspergillus terreus NIH2624]EAU38246.1 conserved hypothetical protein [Aspergillus terreus NIH2624]